MIPYPAHLPAFGTTEDALTQLYSVGGIHNMVGSDLERYSILFHCYSV